MREVIVGKDKEIYFLKDLKRPEGITERWENVLLSLAHIENEYRNRHGNDGISFDNWLTGGVKGLGKSDYRKKYLDALMKPIDGYKKFEGVNKCRDQYYQSKLDAGLITPFTEKELKKRSFSPKMATPWDKDGKPRVVLQGKHEQEIGFDVWFDYLTMDNPLAKLGDNPESLFIKGEDKSEDRERIKIRLGSAGFTPHDIEVIFAHYDTINDGRGAKKEIQKRMKITRGKFNYLLQRWDKFLVECEVLISNCSISLTIFSMNVILTSRPVIRAFFKKYIQEQLTKEGK